MAVAPTDSTLARFRVRRPSTRQVAKSAKKSMSALSATPLAILLRRSSCPPKCSRNLVSSREQKAISLPAGTFSVCRNSVTRSKSSRTTPAKRPRRLHSPTPLTGSCRTMATTTGSNSQRRKVSSLKWSVTVGEFGQRSTRSCTSTMLPAARLHPTMTSADRTATSASTFLPMVNTT